jgi:hypothetical protein
MEMRTIVADVMDVDILHAPPGTCIRSVRVTTDHTARMPARVLVQADAALTPLELNNLLIGLCDLISNNEDAWGAGEITAEEVFTRLQAAGRNSEERHDDNSGHDSKCD